jgi:hypothetical protein
MFRCAAGLQHSLQPTAAGQACGCSQAQTNLISKPQHDKPDEAQKATELVTNFSVYPSRALLHTHIGRRQTHQEDCDKAVVIFPWG